MKKIILCLSIFGAATFTSMGQVRKWQGPLESTPRFSSEHVQSASRAGGGSPVTASQVDTIWYEDFGNGFPAGWTLSGMNSGDCPWVYSTDGSWGFWNGNNGTSGAAGLQSTTGANGFLINDPDSANNALYGQPSGTTYLYMETFVTTDAISTLGYPAVRLEFEQFFRYNNDPELQVGVSTDGVNFTFFDARNGVASNQTSANPMLYSLDISAIASNQPTVYLRFGWSSRVYYWMIDDIRLVTPPANDLELQQVYFNGYEDSTASRYYTSIPEKQANSDSINFGFALRNLGSAPATNIQVNIDATRDGTPVWSGTSQTTSIGVANVDSVNGTTTFSPDDGLGDYTMRFEVVSDSADYDSTNNVQEVDFVVSENEYRRDNDNSNEGNWYNANGSWEMLLQYEINETDTIVAISCLFPDLNNGYGLEVGDALSFYLYSGNDLQNPIESNEFYIVQAGDIDSWVTVPLQPKVALQPGVYYAGFRVFDSDIAIGSFSGLNEEVPPFISLVRVDPAPNDQWSYTTSLQPFIRVLTSNTAACNGVNITVNGTVIDSLPTGSIDITATGGNDPYAYSWTGPNGFTSSAQNIANLGTQGTYTVVVTDLFGCQSAPQSFNVAGIVSVDEVASNTEVQLFPNPADNEVTLLIQEGSTGSYTLSLHNLQGQLVRESKEWINQSGQVTWDLESFSPGIYLLRVEEPNGTSSVERLIVR